MTIARAQAAEENSADGNPLRIRLEVALPERLDPGKSTAAFCFGTCFHQRSDVRRIRLLVDGVPHLPTAQRMPRLDLFQKLHPRLSVDSERSKDPDSAEDPECRSYRSGFWATVPVRGRAGPDEIEIGVEAELEDGSLERGPLGAIPVADRPRPPAPPMRPGSEVIAICMATYDPDPELFRVQLDSIRGQTDTDWICLISDDHSSPGSFARIEEAIAGDRRFLLSRAERRLGFYRNFERALMMAPDGAELIALCDQDDRWFPEKLEVLRSHLGGRQLVYSDQRLVDPAGNVVRGTLWKGRRNNHRNFASELIANTIGGAASLFRREVAELALPFPEGPGWQFHDHWLGIVAMASGEVGYVDRALYDYVQHPGAVTGQVVAEAAGAGPGSRSPGGRGRKGTFNVWKAAYLREYLQIDLQARAALARCSERLTPRKRRAIRLLTGAGSSPAGAAWLALRRLRRLAGRTETLDTEGLLCRGIAWRHLIERRMGSRSLPNGATYDASLPAFDPDVFGDTRVRRWRAAR